MSAYRLQRAMHSEAGRMLSVSGYTISMVRVDDFPVEAAVCVQLRNPGRMETKVRAVVLAFTGVGANQLYKQAWGKVDVAAGDGIELTSPFYLARAELVDCMVTVTLGDGQVLQQALHCYAPDMSSDRWPVVEL